RALLDLAQLGVQAHPHARARRAGAAARRRQRAPALVQPGAARRGGALDREPARAVVAAADGARRAAARRRPGERAAPTQTERSSSMKPEDTVSVRVTHRFGASAERVFDAWLDPSKVCKFLFATATGQIVRAEVDARVGGGFTIVDRRGQEEVAHVGTYLEIARPRRLVFDLTVPKYSSDPSRVEIQIEPLAQGCELTLVQHMPARYAEVRGRTAEGWRRILEALDQIEPP